MAAAGPALPFFVFGIDPDRLAACVRHSAVHRRRCEAPYCVAVRSDRDHAALSAKRAYVLQHGVERVLKLLAAKPDAFGKLMRGN